MNSKFQVLIKDTIVFGLGSIGSKVILFLLVPLYTNYMSKDEYGIADLVFTVGQLIIPFVSLVIFDSVIRFGLSKYEKRENVLLVGLVVGIFSSLLTLLLTPLFSIYPALAEWRWYLSVYVIVSIFNSIELNYLKAKNLNKLFASLSVFQTAILACLNIYYLIFAKKGIQGYLLSTIISTLLIVIIAFILGRLFEDLKKSELKPRLMKEMLMYSSPLIFNNVSWWIIHSSDKVMLEAMVSATALGVYTVAAKIPSLINVGVSVFQQAWGISTVKEIENDNDTNYYSTVFSYLLCFTAFLCVFFVAIIKLFMHYYVGESFQDAWKFVPLLLVSAVFGSIAAYYGSLYGALKKSVNNMITTLIAALANLIFNFVLIRTISVWGAVIATAISYFLLALLRMIDVKRYVDLKIDHKKVLFIVVVLVTQALLVSINWHGCVVSSVAIILLVYTNQKELFKLLSLIKDKKNEKNKC